MDIFILDCENFESTSLSYEFLLFILQKKFPNVSPNVIKTQFGKPVVNNIKDFHFSISHSDRFLVIATHTQPIGVDVQKIKSTNLKIVDRFFSKDEINAFSSVPKNKQLSYFFDLWTLKESFVKCCGLGFSNMPFYSFSIIIDDNITIKMSNGTKINYNFSKYDIKSNYKLALCYEGKIVKPNFININLKKISK